ncbi:hypothetical protein CHR61_10255 [Faecalibacterium prausnitzii]|uniref:Uncharacterized protein n=1 Tax=Faecalibacterium prausnitzii TaxID=853 RepID=A0A2A7BBJ9_9FIRM|nr:hypothetical protein CHR61_10255 [Faecalibacterium prausnitzii]
MEKNHRLRSVVLFVLLALCGMVWYTRLSSTTRNLEVHDDNKNCYNFTDGSVLHLLFCKAD